MQMLPPSIMLSLLAEAPPPMKPLRVDRDARVAPEVPRVCLPLPPLGFIELPQSDSFGSTSPVPSVGGSGGEDGGIPRRVKRTTAAVVPPIFLTPSCTERVTKAVWTCVDPAPVLEPPEKIIVPATSRPSSSAELVNEALMDFPSGEGFLAIPAAVCDLPRACEGCDIRSTARPVRKSAPTIVAAVRRETESSDEGDDKDDAAVAAGESEMPSLVAGTDEVASKALEILDKEYPGSSSCVPMVTPPASIKRESVAQSRSGFLAGDRISWVGNVPRGSVALDQNVVHLKDLPQAQVFVGGGRRWGKGGHQGDTRLTP
eukprot:g8721.t1